jgi:hypothetical protein
MPEDLVPRVVEWFEGSAFSENVDGKGSASHLGRLTFAEKSGQAYLEFTELTPSQ